jgi:hypothetical protein
MNNARTAAIAISESRAVRLALIAVAFVSALYYAYAIQETVKNVALRQEVQAELVRAEAEASDLEFRAIALKNSVTVEKALAMGFVPYEKTTFLSRETSVAFAGRSQTR